MARFKQLYKIIEDVVKAISWNIPITGNVDDGDDKYTLTVECTAYLNNCIVFKDAFGDEWEVLEFVFNESLQVKGFGHTKVFTDTSIVLGAPTFLHGTVRLTNAAYTMTDRKQDILPIIYLYETLNERVNLDVKLAIERTARPTIFFLMSNKFEDYIQVKYDSMLYDPLSNIEEKFIEELIKNVNISEFTERYDRKNHDQFGYTDRNGTLKHLFSDALSALELNIPLNINKCSSKNNNC